MAELLSARDKLPQIEQQIRNAEMERYLLELRTRFTPGEPGLGASDFEIAAYTQLKNEADGARAAVIVWDHKLTVLRPIYEELKADLAAQEKAGTAPRGPRGD